jgi:hypothetical protein
MLKISAVIHIRSSAAKNSSGRDLGIATGLHQPLDFRNDNQISNPLKMNVFLRICGFLLLVFLLAAGALWFRSSKSAPLPATPAPVDITVSDQPAPAPEATPVPAAAVVQTDSPLRTWTSRDGRTIQAEYIYATATAVTIKRNDGRVFTLPLANLAAEDADWVARHPRSIEPAALRKEPDAPARPVISQVQIDSLVATFPAPPSLHSREITNDLKQLHTKYLDMVKFIRPGTIPQNLKMIRAKIADDVKQLEPVAQTAAGDWSGKRLSGQSAAAENGILSARESLSWLQNALPAHLEGYERLLTATDSR